MITSFNKFLVNENNLKIYVGSSISSLFKNLIKIESIQNNWKRETLFQLSEIKRLNPLCKNVLLVLDDFIFKSDIDFSKLSELNNYIIGRDIPYLSLKKSNDSVVRSFFNKWFSIQMFDSFSMYPIRRSHPYYYSLQVAIWDIDYLIDSITNCDDIWNFELMRTRTKQHFSLSDNFFEYEHIVEKGQWDFNAKSICEKYIGFFKPGDRKFRNLGILSYSLLKLRLLSFSIFGYFFFRLTGFIKSKI
jgi:hypothetical protein